METYILTRSSPSICQNQTKSNQMSVNHSLSLQFKHDTYQLPCVFHPGIETAHAKTYHIRQAIAL
eukprot:134779-Hanusia_phi.AAC.8